MSILGIPLTGLSDAQETRDAKLATAATTSSRRPLLYLHAHWTLRAHRHYLAAANFVWRQ